ncbi:nuclear transport factor 2 family protein [Acidaminobacter sp. JC074]|uniref:nuclear transport factor 2 family protein n=1 Tax=Acidaminobacter sp. JC074 TaxID=2530199 RepID=UPI001F104CFE|nr:nuclear transport factor 2 family protein [Acidaminobacter sp. JC074]
MSIKDINKRLVREFFMNLEEGSAEGVANLFAEDGLHINPYASGLFPEGVKGRDAIKKYWEGPIENFDGMTFPIDEIYAMEDEKIVFVKFTGNINLKDGGVYSNDYYSTFKFDDNHEIIEYVEIFNPIVAARGFGLIDQIK